jgi:phosphoglycolate phosphatase-like HAD superfamily hydrolase
VLQSSQTQDTTGLTPRPQISHVVFDFDGTLSWLRHGWPEMMAGIFLKRIPADDRHAIHETLLADILSLNGKSSIFQMERCAQRIREERGPDLDPQNMLTEYLGVLHRAVGERIEQLKRSEVRPDDFVVHGARTFLEKMQTRGLVMVILSGTEETQVKHEAGLLGLTDFFGTHIYGGTANLVQSSKQAVIERLLREEKISGEHLLSFGDGPVEIRVTKQAGGLTVGVASDEDVNGSGKLHSQKVPQLREAGADLLIPDYRDPDALLERILGPNDVPKNR